MPHARLLVDPGPVADVRAAEVAFIRAGYGVQYLYGLDRARGVGEEGNHRSARGAVPKGELVGGGPVGG